MTLRNLIRPLYRVFRERAKSATAVVISYKYRNSVARNHSSFEYVANLLVVKKPIYAQLARLCAESFLFYNPKCKVIINVDEATELAVTKAFRKVGIKRNIEIRNVGENEDSWQDIKLKVILDLRGSNDFFMDADLRWNGPLTQLNSLTFFVNEFELKDNPPYSRLLEFSGWQSNREFTMKNTSFLFWGNYKPTESDFSFINQTMDKIQDFCDQGVISQEDAVSIKRISEQIALSALVDVRNLEVNFLKKVDGYRDGSFVESSYFGATGSAF
jgi:hypothetical protein